MDRTLGIFGALAVILILVAAVMVTTAKNTPQGNNSPDNALKVAKNFIMSDETFKFDGMKDTLILSVTGAYPDAGTYEVTAEFTSAHSGYGDRTNVMVLQVLTPHICVLTITNGEVTSAVMDGTYDMLSQKSIQ